MNLDRLSGSCSQTHPQLLGPEATGSGENLAQFRPEDLCQLKINGCGSKIKDHLLRGKPRGGGAAVGQLQGGTDKAHGWQVDRTVTQMNKPKTPSGINVQR